MKTRVLSILLSATFFLTAVTSIAQISVVEPGTTEALNGQTFVITDYIDLGDNGQYMNKALHVINESDETLTLRCQRTEVDVVPGTEHGVCWVFCPFPDLVAGVEPVYIVNTEENGELTETVGPGETVQSFSIHHNPMGQSGISLFRLDILGEDDESLAHFFVEFNANALSIEELRSKAKLTLSPNPVSTQLNVDLQGLDVPAELIVTDLLGQRVQSILTMPGSTMATTIDAADLRNGIYLLSVIAEGDVVKTSKFVVSH